MEPFPIDDQSIVTFRRDLTCSRLHDELLAMDAQAGYCYSLNSSATRIWELISEPEPIGGICNVLCAEFGVDRETCRRDLIEFLSDMQDAGLIKVEHGASV